MRTDATAFCLSDDREDCETGLRLAILSLAKHCPDAPIYVYRPALNPRFESWVQQFRQVTLIPHAPPGANTWNCKPQAMKPLLAKGHRDVVWLDSDVIVTRDCRQLFATLDERVLGVAQEPASLPHQGTAHRTRGWGLEVSRSLPFTLNSAVVRVTKHHQQLLDRWMECLADPGYIDAQSLPLEQRALHLMGDQDILNALLGALEFSNIPLHVFGTGRDIIHAGGGLGYSVSERLCGVFKPKPAFLHATAGKPWLWLGGAPYWSQPNFFSWHRRLLQEVSPYLHEARRYRGRLDQDSAWMFKRTGMGTLLRLFGFGHFAIRGLPLTIAASIMDAVKKVRGGMQTARREPILFTGAINSSSKNVSVQDHEL
jgi:hypothetical protein